MLSFLKQKLSGDVTEGVRIAVAILYFIVYIQCCVGCAAVDDIVV